MKTKGTMWSILIIVQSAERNWNSHEQGHNPIWKVYRMTRKNLKISKEAFDELKADKPPGVTWDYYLTEIRTVE